MNIYETVKTERLSLVPIDESFAQEIFNNFTSEITTYMAVRANDSIDETKIFIEMCVDQRENDISYTYAITSTIGNEFLGCCGINKLQDEIPELGIWLKSSAQGHHYGQEAIGGLILVATEIGLDSLQYFVDKRNTSSKKIAIFYGGKLKGTFNCISKTGNRLIMETYLIPLPQQV
ncbi:MAG: GNAT family N-acetyltransferase [Clostridia bacterium]